MKPKYNHAFEVAFEVISHDEDGADITPAMLEEALIARAKQLTADREWDEAADHFDTYEMMEAD